MTDSAFFFGMIYKQGRPVDEAQVFLPCISMLLVYWLAMY